VLECQCLRPYKYIQMGSRFCLFHAAANVRAGQLKYQNDVHRSFHLESWKVLAAGSLRETRPTCPESVSCASCYLVYVLLNVARADQTMWWFYSCHPTYLCFTSWSHATSSSHDMGLRSCDSWKKLMPDTTTSLICISKIPNCEHCKVSWSS
jgi:hypothetical protein